VIADRYGQAAYGTIAGVAATVTITARAVAPVTAAVYVASSDTPRFSGRSPRWC
jgi:hypothetical protein